MTFGSIREQNWNKLFFNQSCCTTIKMCHWWYYMSHIHKGITVCVVCCRRRRTGRLTATTSAESASSWRVAPSSPPPLRPTDTGRAGSRESQRTSATVAPFQRPRSRSSLSVCFLSLHYSTLHFTSSLQAIRIQLHSTSSLLIHNSTGISSTHSGLENVILCNSYKWLLVQFLVWFSSWSLLN